MIYIKFNKRKLDDGLAQTDSDRWARGPTAAIPKPSAPPRAAATVGPLQTLSPAARSGPPEERLGVSVTCSATVIRVLGARVGPQLGEPGRSRPG